MSTRGKRSPAKKPSGTTSGTQGDKIGKAGPSIPFTTRRRVNKTVGITNTPPLEVLKQALPSEVQREVAAAAPAPTPEEKMALRKAREGKRPARAHSRQTAEALRKAREAEALRKAREGKRPVTEQQAVPMKLDETHAAGMENQIPKFVGQYETLVPHIDPKAQQAAQEAVDRWISTFTPGGPPPPPTEDPESLQNQLNYAVLELQADAIAAGDVPPPPPLSTAGLALRSFYKMGKFDLTTTLQVQQEILELIGRKRQKLVEETARRLLIVERCIASNYAFNALGITANIKNLLTELLVSGQLPVSFMDILASFISENGGLDIIMNPMGWFASNLGSLVTVDAVNTYIAIWLSNQLIGAQIFAQMTNDEDLNQRIETTGRDLLEQLQRDNTFFDQIGTLSSEIATLFDKATANLMAIISTGFNLPEIIIRGTVVTTEQMLAEIPNVLQRFVTESARQTQNYAQLEEQRRGMARDVAIQYRDAEEVARLVVEAAPTRPGLHDLTHQIISQLIGATGPVIRSALV